MRPQDTTPPQPTVHVPQRDGYSLVYPRQNPASPQSIRPSHDATANIARQQIETIYSSDDRNLMDAEPQPSPQPATAHQASDSPRPAPKPSPAVVNPAASNQPRNFHQRTIEPLASNDDTKSPYTQDLTIENPYQRSMDETNLKASTANWQQYHSAWQKYYQQYFHRYYASEVEKAQAQLESERKRAGTNIAPTANIGITQNQAVNDIRAQLRAKVSERAKKVRRSRHFVPIAAALGVMLVFTFLQYNRVMFSNIQAYVTPGGIEPANIIVDPNVRSSVGMDPLLVIPKINVQVPVVWDVTPDHNSQMEAMEEGVAWFGIPGANSKPGQIGNTVLSGHSSNDFFETGDYKFVFAPLEKLEPDDTIEVHYRGTLYTYVVTKKEVVLPTEVDKLIYDTDKPMLTLITCTPLGTALKRLLVTAEQVSPSPSKAKPAPRDSGSSGSAEMPGNEPTLLERAFSR